MSEAARFTSVCVAFYLLMIAGVAVWGLLDSTVVLWPLLEMSPVLAGQLAVAVGVAVLTIGFSWMAAQRWRWAQRLADQFAPILGGLSIGQVVVVALMSGLAEELLFRGCLLPHLGVVWSALVFGALHGFFVPRYLGWSLFALALGLVWGIMVSESGMLVPVVVSHVLVNLVNILKLRTWKGRSV